MLREAIQKLPAQYRIVLVLRDMEGLTDEDVAEITGLRPGTVRVRLHRARLFVRKELMKSWKPLAAHSIGSECRMTHLPRSRNRHAVRLCSPNFRTTSMSNWMTLCVRNWKSTWTVAGHAKCFWQVSKRAIEQCRKSPGRAPAGEDRR